MQNYYNIEQLNKLKFARFAKQFAISYNDAAAVNVLEHMKYKKSTKNIRFYFIDISEKIY